MELHSGEISIRDGKIQGALKVCLKVYENTNDGDHFWVSDFYRLATSITPDLTFALLGARYLVNDKYMAMFREQSNKLRDRQKEDGNMWYECRAMYQILYPIWVYVLYMYTGDREYLDSHRRAVSKTLEYLFSHEDERGFVKLVGTGEWKLSEGADWVDWCAERMEGKTMVFQTWYFRCLLLAAYVMETLGELKKATVYKSKASHLRENINKMFWTPNHYLDNIDYEGRTVDHFWLDSQLWPIVFGIASPSQSMYILNHIDCMGDYDEGVPVRWRESPDVLQSPMDNIEQDNGDCSWFGRLGSADILARYRMGYSGYALKLLYRISELFIRDDTIYECYDMHGNAMPKNIGGGNYLEHAGGYVMSVMEGMFGIEFPIDTANPLILHPKFSAPQSASPGTSAGTEARTQFMYLGKKVSYEYTCSPLDGERFQRTIRLYASESDGAFDARVILDFAHPLPKFTTIHETLVDGKKRDARIDSKGRMILDLPVPGEVSVVYHERLNSELKGLSEDHALTDCK